MSTKLVEEEINSLNKRLQNVLTNLSKCKTDFLNGTEECKSLRDANTKLEIELREVRESEKSHRYHLVTTRETIKNLQETVSHLVYLKKDVILLEEQLTAKEAYLIQMEKDKENALLNQDENFIKIQADYEKRVEDIKINNYREIQQIQQNCEAQVGQFTCVAEELRAKMRDLEAVNTDKINMVLLEYEEKIQREANQVAQLREELVRETARSDLNINAYKRRLEELEEKLKQSHLKEYLLDTCPSQESKTERPCSVTRDRDYQDYSLDNIPGPSPIQDNTKTSFPTQRKSLKCANSLQIKPENLRDGSDEKKLFQITKKKKLFNTKNFYGA